MTQDYINEGDGYVDIALKKAIKIDGTDVQSVRMREPLVSDQMVMDAMKGTDAVKEIGLFANLCDLKPADIQGLSLRDYKRVQAGFQTFTD